MSSAEPSRGEPAAAEAALAAWAGAALGVPVAGVERVPAGIGLRALLSPPLRGAARRTAIARVEAAEDPAGRPAGSAPEPPLEPVRALLERAGLPVPRRYAATRGAASSCSRTSAPSRSATRFARAAPRRARRARRARARAGAAPPARARTTRSGVAAFGRRLDARAVPLQGGALRRREPRRRARRAPSPAETPRGARTPSTGSRATASSAPQRLAHRDFQSHNLLVRRDAGRRPALDDDRPAGRLPRAARVRPRVPAARLLPRARRSPRRCASASASGRCCPTRPRPTSSRCASTC